MASRIVTFVALIAIGNYRKAAVTLKLHIIKPARLAENNETKIPSDRFPRFVGATIRKIGTDTSNRRLSGNHGN